jgi:hypothetical protein
MATGDDDGEAEAGTRGIRTSEATYILGHVLKETVT